MKWFAFLPLNILMNLLAYVLAPVLPIFAVNRMGASDNGSKQAIEPRLPSWLNWFMTPDNSLWGDEGWRKEHCPRYWDTYIGMVGWLWRNPAYGFDRAIGATILPDDTVSFRGNPQVQDKPAYKAGYCFTTIRDYWHLKFVSEYCNFDFGWRLKTYAEDPSRIETQPLAPFVFSPRFK